MTLSYIKKDGNLTTIPSYDLDPKGGTLYYRNKQGELTSVPNYVLGKDEFVKMAAGGSVKPQAASTRNYAKGGTVRRR